MACGAAVLTARRLSLPEVGGDAVAYTEPDADSIAEALRALIEDAPRRPRLSRSGQERAKEFTREASANAHLETYRQAVAGVTV
jgi:glycosyltransferase involved in cell wall biosynthesis